MPEIDLGTYTRLEKLRKAVNDEVEWDVQTEAATFACGSGGCYASYDETNPDTDFADLLAVVEAVDKLCKQKKQCILCLCLGNIHAKDCPMWRFK